MAMQSALLLVAPSEPYYGSYLFFKTYGCSFTSKSSVFSNSHLLVPSSHMHMYNTRKVDKIVSVEEKA